MLKRKDGTILGTAFSAILILAACSSGLQTSPGIQEPELTAQADSTSWQRIATATDDAEETLSTGAMVLDSTDLDFGSNASGSTAVGVRFTNLGIPKGAIIKSVNLYFLPKTDSVGVATMAIRMHSSYTSNTFKTTNKDITSRSLTNTSVSWTVPSWKTTMTLQSPEVKSPNLISLVQPLVNNGAVDSLTFAIEGTGSRIAESFEGTSGNKSALEVIYALPTTTGASCLTGSTNILNWTNQTYSKKFLSEQPVKTGVNAKGSRFSGSDALTITRNPKPLTGGAGYICLSSGFYTPNLSKGDNSVWDCSYLKVYKSNGDLDETATNAAKSRCNSDGAFHARNAIVVGIPNFKDNDNGYGASKNTTIENVAVGTTGDAFTIKNSADDWTVRNSYVRHAGDDAVESDFFNAGVVDNILVDWAYTGFSCRKGTTAQEANVPFTIKNSLLALRPQHGTATESNVDTTKGIPEHYQLFKWNQDTKKSDGTITYYARKGCRLTLQNNVFLITKENSGHINTERNGNTTYASSWDAFDETGCRDNLVIYLGSDQTYINRLNSDVATLPAGCFTVKYPTPTVSRTSLINLWHQKRSEWFDRNPQFEIYRNSEPVAPGF